MDIFKIEGPVELSGDIRINGSKNAALPIMAATILAPGKSTILDVPDLADINVLKELLSSLGATVETRENGEVDIDTSVIDNPVGEYDIVRKMRASICILGPLVARCGRAEVSMPGGCAVPPQAVPEASRCEGHQTPGLKGRHSPGRRPGTSCQREIAS